ncbi:hypothetical protein CDD83_7153 [Cordyceps sp. RAO-2017]|nr:hypothetical protein CDD83_7153 [Cordyceps sp. RAO-2017]
MADTVAANQTYFNKLASEYDTLFQEAMLIMERQLRDNIDFLGIREGGRLLDYACGTGMLSFTLGDRLSQCVGVDVSESMVEAYNAKARSRGLSEEQCSAHVGNLIDATDASPEALSAARFGGFDGAGVGAGFHHFDDCGLAARRLAERLCPGGVLFVLDFVAHEACSSGMSAADAAAHGVRHHGFSEVQVRELFREAGVGSNFAFRVMGKDIVFRAAGEGGRDMVRTVFLARGEKS